MAAVTEYAIAPPLGIETVSAMGPLPDVVHVAPPEGVHVQDANVMPGGGLSLTTRPLTAFGPAFATPSV